MTKQKSGNRAAGETAGEAFDPDRAYVVKVREPVAVAAGINLRPGATATLKGRLISAAVIAAADGPIVPADA